MTTSTYKGVERTLQDNFLKAPSLYASGNLHVMYDTYTILTAEGTSPTLEINFARLLPGKVLILPQLSWISCSDADANADLHLGFRAYTDSTGAAVNEDDNYWIDNADVGGGALQGLIPAITGVTTAGAQPLVFDCPAGLQMYMLVDTADANISDTYTICVVYAHIQ